MATKERTVALLTADVEPRWQERLEEIESPVESIRLPEADGEVSQDEEWCEVVINGSRRRIRFHDYDEIYKVPGLYERIFYERLKCRSPSRVARLFADVLRDAAQRPEDLRVLDLGAGNGMLGDELRAHGIDFVVGVDVIAEAKEAAYRDRPGIYDDYLVVDLTDPDERARARLEAQRFNCLTCVAALGFDDIPPRAFLEALEIIETPAWLAFSIKESFVNDDADSPFASLIWDLQRDGVIRLEAYRRFPHRLSISGEPLHYVAVIARKLRELEQADWRGASRAES